MISWDGSIQPCTPNGQCSYDATITQANLLPTGGGGWALQQAIRTDGVNDFSSTMSGGSPVKTSNSFNPFNDSDWTVAFWARSEPGLTFRNNGTAMGVGTAIGSNPETFVRFENYGIGARFGISSNSQFIQSTWVGATASFDDAHHYVITCEQNGANQDIEIYIDGVNVDSLTISANTITETDVSLVIGAARADGVATNGLRGYMQEIVLANAAASAAQVSDLYNAGAGANPVGIIPSIHSYYPVSEAAGTTTGQIANSIGNQDLDLTNMTSGYGVVAGFI